ncbi:MAG: hypothetical protein ACJ75B_19710 [Flavisolibacter sp.]
MISEGLSNKVMRSFLIYFCISSLFLKCSLHSAASVKYVEFSYNGPTDKPIEPIVFYITNSFDPGSVGFFGEAFSVSPAELKNIDRIISGERIISGDLKLKEDRNPTGYGCRIAYPDKTVMYSGPPSELNEVLTRIMDSLTDLSQKQQVQEAWERIYSRISGLE